MESLPPGQKNFPKPVAFFGNLRYDENRIFETAYRYTEGVIPYEAL